MTSNPCLNGGKCLLPSPSSQKRFACNCPNGYQGERCEQPIKSCRGYSNTGRVPGNYTVIDGDLRPFQVFCDFDSNSSTTWTLIQSYKLKNKEEFRGKTFAGNLRKNQHEPFWSRYRLSKSAMESIQNESTRWRITCRYEADSVVYIDYVRALNKELDILIFDGKGKCVNVEYINIRGHSCTACAARFWQGSTQILHTDSSKSSNCGFTPQDGSLHCGAGGEDNFGLYDCINEQHRCSSSDEATTQTWFGGRD